MLFQIFAAVAITGFIGIVVLGHVMLFAAIFGQAEHAPESAREIRRDGSVRPILHRLSSI